MSKKVKIGDWVRFYNNGKLVIGVVEYTSTSVIGTIYLQTTEGQTDEDSVLEYRRNITFKRTEESE